MELIYKFIKFIFDIKKPPVYAKLVQENIISGLRNKNIDLRLYFFSSRSQTNTIAPSNINFIINKKSTISIRKGGFTSNNWEVTENIEPIIIQNAGLNTNISIPNLPLYREEGQMVPRGRQSEWIKSRVEKYEYIMQPSDINNYVIIN